MEDALKKACEPPSGVDTTYGNVSSPVTIHGIGVLPTMKAVPLNEEMSQSLKILRGLWCIGECEYTGRG